eukprot:Anaeramoba_ignava/c19549_g1_i1.p1 GENE.c19549_g1_i1~~c19549_g1_i1.p1  ORF type:complete len:340 (+),score=105.86 c19549_g1_i1:46-1020(+)
MLSSVEGFKILLLDDKTTQFISILFSQTEILGKEVFLVDKINKSRREEIKHLQAIFFIQPTNENIEILDSELSEPKYAGYHLFFSNILNQNQLGSLAHSDKHRIVKQVQEFYIDYLAINESLFQFNIPKISHIFNSSLENDPLIDSLADRILSVLLSLQTRPNIRFQTPYKTTQILAQKIESKIRKQNQLFDFSRKDQGSILLILDRRSDPLTPLLNQWTYQAMLHEFFGIKSNIISLKHLTGIRKDMEEIVLSPKEDHFYHENMFKNFGDLGDSMKNLVDDFSKKIQNHSKYSINRRNESIHFQILRVSIFIHLRFKTCDSCF